MLISVSTSLDPFAEAQGKFKPESTESLTDVAAIMFKSAYSPIVFKNNWRAQKNFLSCQLLALDFDHPDKSIGDAKDYFIDIGVRFVIGATRNHQKLKDGRINDRYRVVIPMTSAITDLGLFRANMKKFIEIFKTDNQCADGARLYYPCIEIFHVQSEGMFIQWNRQLPPDTGNKITQEQIDTLEGYGELGVIPPWMTRCAEEYALNKQRNGGVFYLSCKMYHMKLSVAQVCAWMRATPLKTLDEEDPNEIDRTVTNGFAAAEKEKGEMDSPISN